MKRVTARRKALAIASILGLVAIGGASALGNPNGDMPMIISIREILGSCVVAFLIGLVFGFLPARKAAHLDPVDALSRE